MAERVRVREIDDDEGQRLLRIVRRSSGSVMTWRRAQMILLSAQGMESGKIARVTFTSPDRVRDVIHNFNTDGLDFFQPIDGPLGELLAYGVQIGAPVLQVEHDALGLRLFNFFLDPTPDASDGSRLPGRIAIEDPPLHEVVGP